MKGYRTDENGRWSPAYRVDTKEDIPLLIIVVLALLLFASLFLQWWFV